MNSSGDAAEQVVHLSLEGTEMVLRLTGSAAKNVAAAIYAIWKNRDKTQTKGHQRLDAMLNSGKELKVFTISEEHLKLFSQEAKRYGVVYCALRGKEKSADGMVDIMVRAEDASKINRIVDRFKLATVDAAAIKQSIEQSRAEKAAKAAEQPQPTPDLNDPLLADLLGIPRQPEEPAAANPTVAKTEKSPLSEPISGTPMNAARGTTEDPSKRPSVRQELRDIAASRQAEAEKKNPEREAAPKAPAARATKHRQPVGRKRTRQKAR